MEKIKDILKECHPKLLLERLRGLLELLRGLLDKCNPKVLKISAISGGGALAMAVLLIVWFTVAGGEPIRTDTEPHNYDPGLDIDNPPDTNDPGDDDGGAITLAPVVFTTESATTTTTTSSSAATVTSGNSTTEPEPQPLDPFVRITLNGDSVTATKSSSGMEVQIEGQRVQIDHPGEYRVSGTLNNGSIVVDADGDVLLVLEGVNITRSDGPCIRTTRQMESSTLTIRVDGNSTIRDNRDHVPSGIDPEEQGDDVVELFRHGAIFSHAGRLTITGGGHLTVHGGMAHGINARNEMVIDRANITVHAPTHGLRSRLTTNINASNITINSGSKGIRTAGNNHGHLFIYDSTINITSRRDAIHTEQNVTISNSNITAVVHDGWASGRWEDTMKGMRVGGNAVINGGTFSLDCAEDGIAASGSTTIDNARIDVWSTRRAVRGRDGLTVRNSTVTVHVSNYGFRGLFIDINNSTVSIHSATQGLERGTRANVIFGIPENPGWINLNGENFIAISGETEKLRGMGFVYTHCPSTDCHNVMRHDRD
jgi:hypothetical protein